MRSNVGLPNGFGQLGQVIATHEQKDVVAVPGLHSAIVGDAWANAVKEFIAVGGQTIAPPRVGLLVDVMFATLARRRR